MSIPRPHKINYHPIASSKGLSLEYSESNCVKTIYQSIR